LNSGGCGELFLCYPLEDMNIRYVLKVLKSTDTVNRCRFEREAAILSSIRNERIASVIEYIELEENSIIIMEYINGQNLKELHKDYQFSEQSSLLIIRETAIALQYIWDNYFIIHRDIKPENIMLDERNHLKLLDFGLSKQVNMGETTMITMASSGLGTPGYMSPEQFTDSKHVDFRSDIFSLGATLFFLVTGEKPFTGSTTQEIYTDTLRNSPPKFQRLASRCSRDCIQLIRRMMQKEPRDRYGSYSELIQDINNLLQV
jgi:serine/threonine protein kinase